MAALLGQQLVLNLYGTRAGFLERPHHMHDVQHFAETGVSVDQHRQLCGPRDLSRIEADVVDGDDAEVRQAHRGRHCRARQIQRFEAGVPGLQGRQAVVGAGHLQDAGPFHQLAEAQARGFVRKMIGNQVGHLGSGLLQRYCWSHARVRPHRDYFSHLPANCQQLTIVAGLLVIPGQKRGGPS